MRAAHPACWAGGRPLEWPQLKQAARKFAPALADKWLERAGRMLPMSQWNDHPNARPRLVARVAKTLKHNHHRHELDGLIPAARVDFTLLRSRVADLSRAHGSLVQPLSAAVSGYLWRYSGRRLLRQAAEAAAFNQKTAIAALIATVNDVEIAMRVAPEPVGFMLLRSDAETCWALTNTLLHYIRQRKYKQREREQTVRSICLDIAGLISDIGRWLDRAEREFAAGKEASRKVKKQPSESGVRAVERSAA
jgi:hypothetical protein